MVCPDLDLAVGGNVLPVDVLLDLWWYIFVEILEMFSLQQLQYHSHSSEDYGNHTKFIISKEKCHNVNMELNFIILQIDVWINQDS